MVSSGTYCRCDTTKMRRHHRDVNDTEIGQRLTTFSGREVLNREDIVTLRRTLAQRLYDSILVVFICSTVMYRSLLASLCLISRLFVSYFIFCLHTGRPVQMTTLLSLTKAMKLEMKN